MMMVTVLAIQVIWVGISYKTTMGQGVILEDPCLYHFAIMLHEALDVTSSNIHDDFLGVILLCQLCVTTTYTHISKHTSRKTGQTRSSAGQNTLHDAGQYSHLS
jgi:hypothetical protein